jgi:hypothetical protein
MVAKAKPSDDDLQDLPPDLRWVFCHPRMQSGKPDVDPVKASETKGAPSAVAVALLKQSLPNPSRLLDAVRRMILENAKARLKQRADERRQRLQAELKRQEADAELDRQQRVAKDREERERMQGSEEEPEWMDEEVREIRELQQLARTFRQDALHGMAAGE